MRDLLLFAIGLILIIGSVFLFWNRPVPGPVHVRIGDATISVEIASTMSERARGLSGREMLAEGTGMLFVFDEPNRYSIWMKGMLFPIDIIWISEAGRVVALESDVSPDTYPQSFYPEVPAKYVVEVKAGFVRKYNIDIGDEVSFDTGIIGYPHILKR